MNDQANANILAPAITIELLNYPPVYGSPLRTYTHWWMVRVGTPDICEAGQTANPITGKCPVGALTPYSPDPYPLDTNNLSDRMKTALQCMRNADTTATPTSAYRPPAYNQHLIDVWNKWDELKENENPACQTLRADVQAHFNRHGLLESQPPVLNSAHTRGEAIDLTSSLPIRNLDALAERCELRRPLPVTDPVHFIHR